MMMLLYECNDVCILSFTYPYLQKQYPTDLANPEVVKAISSVELATQTKVFVLFHSWTLSVLLLEMTQTYIF
jgi:hypothetical protein